MKCHIEKAKKPRSKKEKVILGIVISLIIILSFVWGMLAFIQVFSIVNATYDGYTGTKIIAHRGHNSKCFENTYYAYKAAAEEPFFNGIETDIRKTKDGIWVCSHDNNPFVNKSINITESMYDDIKDLPLDISNKKASTEIVGDEKICSYIDYVNLCKMYNKVALIEIKGTYTQEELEEPVGLAITKLGLNHTIFASFNLRSLSAVYKINSHANILRFAHNVVEGYCYTNMGGNVGLNFKDTSQFIVDEAHDRSHYFFAWGIADNSTLNKAKNMYIDYAIVDYCE